MLTLLTVFKGTHTICFSISFHNVNQMLMSSRTNFPVTQQDLDVFVVEMLQCIYLLCDSLLNN